MDSIFISLLCRDSLETNPLQIEKEVETRVYHVLIPGTFVEVLKLALHRECVCVCVYMYLMLLSKLLMVLICICTIYILYTLLFYMETFTVYNPSNCILKHFCLYEEDLNPVAI